MAGSNRTQEEVNVYRQYMALAKDSPMRAVMEEQYPHLFKTVVKPTPSREQIDAIVSQYVPWNEKVKFQKALKRRTGQTLMVTLVLESGQVTFTTSQLLNAKYVRDALVAVTETVPIMPSVKEWPTEVEMILKGAELVEGENETTSPEEYARGELEAFLASGCPLAESMEQRRNAFFDLLSTGTTHAVVYRPIDGAPETVFTHTKAFVGWLQKQHGGIRSDHEVMARDTLKAFFKPFRVARERNYWYTELAYLRETHGIELPVIDIARHEGNGD